MTWAPWVMASLLPAHFLRGPQRRKSQKREQAGAAKGPREAAETELLLSTCLRSLASRFDLIPRTGTPTEAMAGSLRLPPSRTWTSSRCSGSIGCPISPRSLALIRLVVLISFAGPLCARWPKSFRTLRIWTHASWRDRASSNRGKPASRHLPRCSVAPLRKGRPRTEPEPGSGSWHCAGYEPHVAWDLLWDHGETVTYPPSEEEEEEMESEVRERPIYPCNKCKCGTRPFCANCGTLPRCTAACKDHVIAAAVLGPVTRMHSGQKEEQRSRRKATGPPGGR